MMRPFPIAASLAIILTAFAASAQDVPTRDTPAQDATAGTEAPDQAETTVPVDAADTTEAAPEADSTTLTGSIEAGRKLTFTCMGCHGIRGYENAYPTYHVPRIGGQSEQYLIVAMTEYQQGTRKHPTMQAQTSGFSQQQIADIAAFLSSLNP